MGQSRCRHRAEDSRLKAPGCSRFTHNHAVLTLIRDAMIIERVWHGDGPPNPTIPERQAGAVVPLHRWETEAQGSLQTLPGWRESGHLEEPQSLPSTLLLPHSVCPQQPARLSEPRF